MKIREIYNNVVGIPKDGKSRMSYEEFHQAIISAIFEKMPKEKRLDVGDFGMDSITLEKGKNPERWTQEKRLGFNQAISEIKKRIENGV